MTTFDITRVYALWNLTFELQNGQKIRRALPITSPSNNPTLDCTTVANGPDWMVRHRTVQPSDKLVEAELFPIHRDFVATDAKIEVEPVYPSSQRSLAAVCRIPEPAESEYAMNLQMFGDPRWTLTVKVKKKLTT